jgi:choline monooxygenase
MTPDIAEELERTGRGEAGLGGRFFVDGGIFALERRHWFRAGWACIGLAADVPRPGDAAPVDFLGEPLLLVRGDDRRARVFHNVCSHRGAKLVDGPRRGRTLTCPYHAWSYDLDGNLLQTPHAGGPGIHSCAAIERGRLGLRAVPATEWAGLVFANLSGSAPPFAEVVAPLAARWRRHDLSVLRHVQGIGQRPVFRANWKLVVENFVESYHLPWVHRGMNSFNPMEDHYQILGGRHFVGQGVKNHRPQAGFAARLPYLPEAPEHERGNGESMFLPPNLLLIFMSQFLFTNLLFPLDPETTTERVELFVVGDGGADPSLAGAHRELMEVLAQVNGEDIGVCELMQQGRHSGAFSGGAFSPFQEETTRSFQRLYALAMLEGAGVDLRGMPALAEGEIHHDTPARAPAPDPGTGV